MRLCILTSIFCVCTFYFIFRLHVRFISEEGIGEHRGNPITWDLPLVLETTIGDLFDPTAIRNKPLLSGHVSKVTHIKPSEVPLL